MMVMDRALSRSKSSSSTLVVADKSTHLPYSGCVGIFFQLFHWNRKLAKKSIFSKKVLPPANTDCEKLGGKKFRDDDKIPTSSNLLLISEENNGGFPISRKKAPHHVPDREEAKHGLRSPVLVARLMGLESMPIAHNIKHRKDSHAEPTVNKKKVKKGNTTLKGSYSERTGQFDRHTIPKLGADSILPKRLLSNSRRHRTKIMSPMKSPVKAQGRCAPRLIGAAQKILEPGLLPKNRAKSALTYSSSLCKNSHSKNTPILKSFRSSHDCGRFHGEIAWSDGHHLLRGSGITDLKSKLGVEQQSPAERTVFDSLADEIMPKETPFVGSKRSCGQYTCLGEDHNSVQAKDHITIGRSRPCPPIPKRNHDQKSAVPPAVSFSCFPTHAHSLSKMGATFELESECKLQYGSLSKPKNTTKGTGRQLQHANLMAATALFSRNGREESPLHQKYAKGRGAVQSRDTNTLSSSGISFPVKQRNGHMHRKRSGKVDNRCSLACDGNWRDSIIKKRDEIGESLYTSCNTMTMQDIKPVFRGHGVPHKQDCCRCSDSCACDFSSNHSGSGHRLITSTPSVTEFLQHHCCPLFLPGPAPEACFVGPGLTWQQRNREWGPLEHWFEKGSSTLRMWDGLFEEMYNAGAELADSVVSALLDEALLELSRTSCKRNCTRVNL